MLYRLLLFVLSPASRACAPDSCAAPLPGVWRALLSGVTQRLLYPHRALVAPPARSVCAENPQEQLPLGAQSWYTPRRERARNLNCDAPPASQPRMELNDMASAGREPDEEAPPSPEPPPPGQGKPRRWWPWKRRREEVRAARADAQCFADRRRRAGGFTAGRRVARRDSCKCGSPAHILWRQRRVRVAPHEAAEAGHPAAAADERGHRRRPRLQVRCGQASQPPVLQSALTQLVSQGEASSCAPFTPSLMPLPSSCRRTSSRG